MKTTAKEKFEKFMDFMFAPHSCICCQRECDTQNPYRLCSRCEKDFPFTRDKFCLKCGEAIEGDYDFCLNCKETSYEFDMARSVFAYTKQTAPIIMNFKYNGFKTHGKVLGKMMVDFYENSDIVADLATFVPMPKHRQKQRGYNQAEVLCETFCKSTGMAQATLLERVKESPKQATLGREERAKNIKGSFKAINRAAIKGRDILLIDDVFTTGATANECALVLKKTGARSVVVFTLAKTKQQKI